MNQKKKNQLAQSYQMPPRFHKMYMICSKCQTLKQQYTKIVLQINRKTFYTLIKMYNFMNLCDKKCLFLERNVEVDYLFQAIVWRAASLVG